MTFMMFSGWFEDFNKIKSHHLASNSNFIFKLRRFEKSGYVIMSCLSFYPKYSCINKRVLSLLGGGLFSGVEVEKSFV